MNTPLSPNELHPRVLAHLGDCIFELKIRELALYACPSRSIEEIHRYCTQRANATFQVHLLKIMEPQLTEEEQEIVRRSRNVSVSVSRRSNQGIHRLATAFEALMGYLYLSNPNRLEELFKILEPALIESPDASSDS